MAPSFGCYLPPEKNYFRYELACYTLVTAAPGAYDESRPLCLDDTAEAVSIMSAYEEAFVKAYLLNAGVTEAWIGLESRQVHGVG